MGLSIATSILEIAIYAIRGLFHRISTISEKSLDNLAKEAYVSGQANR
jgi:hypothetical protein